MSKFNRSGVNIFSKRYYRDFTEKFTKKLLIEVLIALILQSWICKTYLIYVTLQEKYLKIYLKYNVYFFYD